MAKLGWLLLKHKSLWLEVLTYKYIWLSSILDWLRLPTYNRKGISVIWRTVLNTLPTIRRVLTWRIGNGGFVCIRIDPWIGCGNSYHLPPDLISFFKQNGVENIAQLGDPPNTTIYQQAWLFGEVLDIPVQ